mmetsp:Transcript_23860/g.81347  ORF Transcript_23860/g.81347 Transcript_23860/m.81347 type:complete len:309 (+) Transcript_23860:1954-2880(+)
MSTSAVSVFRLKTFTLTWSLCRTSSQVKTSPHQGLSVPDTTPVRCSRSPLQLTTAYTSIQLMPLRALRYSRKNFRLRASSTLTLSRPADSPWNPGNSVTRVRTGGGTATGAPSVGASEGGGRADTLLLASASTEALSMSVRLVMEPVRPLPPADSTELERGLPPSPSPPPPPPLYGSSSSMATSSCLMLSSLSTFRSFRVSRSTSVTFQLIDRHTLPATLRSLADLRPSVYSTSGASALLMVCTLLSGMYTSPRNLSLPSMSWLNTETCRSERQLSALKLSSWLHLGTSDFRATCVRCVWSPSASTTA